MPSCHDEQKEFALKKKNIVLVGNPNSGKSVVFHSLTGIYTLVSNYPGTTLSIVQGHYKEHSVVDTPGVYGLSSINVEEKTTKDIVLKADKILNVVNAMHLERELFLTLQLIDMGLPLVVALNFMDEVERHGIKIDLDKLSHLLGVKVIPIVAIKNKGIPELRKSLNLIKASTKPLFNYCQFNTSGAFNTFNYSTANAYYSGFSAIKTRRELLLALEGDTDIMKKYSLPADLSPEIIYTERRRRVNEITEKVKASGSKKDGFKKRLGSFMVHPVYGFLFLAGVLYLAYLSIGVFVAQTVVNFTEKTIMQGYYVPLVQKSVNLLINSIANIFSIPNWLNDAVANILTGEFGILTMTVAYVFGLLLPLVIGFYLFLALMEDSGYLPRLAFLIDKFLVRLGLNGKAIIPLILGFGCVTMATITTRMLNTKREKTIASALLNFAVPCSAQLAVITALIAFAGGFFTLTYVMIIVSFFVALGTVLNRFIPGNSSSLVLSLPSLQVPQIRNIILKTFVRTKHFLYEAGLWFLIGAFLISVLQLTGILKFLENLIEPVVVVWMGLPKKAALAYIMGIVRRDFGAAGFYRMALTQIQLLVALVSITLFVPCIAAILILYKERGSKIATLIWAGTIITAFFVGGMIFRIWGLFNGI
ncbi:TPA: ferrous iron transport protein B [Candidatus Woesearchaeota archaeon]|nr:ferrous iron transport protein B [Candidatus Woesearchaeota archaeon]